MKKLISIFLSTLVLFLSVPVLPVKAEAVTVVDFDTAYEIYLHILSLIETTRYASGISDDYGIIIQSTPSYQDFLANLDTIDAYIASHSSELNGVTYTTSDGNTVSLPDWVNDDWKKEGNVISGGIQYKLSVLRSDKASDLQSFHSDMNSGNNNIEDPTSGSPFKKILKVVLGAAAVGAAGVYTFTHGLIDTYHASKIEGTIPYTSRNDWIDAVSGGINAEWAWNGDLNGYNGWHYWNQRINSGNFACFIGSNSVNNDFYYLYISSNPYSTGSSQSFSGWAQASKTNFSNGTWKTNLPVFANTDAFYNWRPSNLGAPEYLDFDYLMQQLNYMLRPLLDTNYNPTALLAIQKALNAGLANIIGSVNNIATNTNEWLEDVPDIIGDILPDYDPIIIPIPIPDPEPDPEPVPPDPEPDPEPDPDPDPPIVDPDPDPDPELPEDLPVISNLQTRFPFSIPWDLKHMVEGLSAEREAPHFEYTLHIDRKWIPPWGYNYTFVIDLSQFDNLAYLFRRLFLISFIIGLAVYSYAKFFGGGE